MMTSSMRILVLGGTGFLGGYLLDALGRDHVVVGSHQDPDRGDSATTRYVELADVESVRRLGDGDWDLILHCAGMTDVDACEREPQRAWMINVEGTDAVARTAPGKLVYFSTDYVFDGSKEVVTEADVPNPLNVYGRTKLEAEERVLRANPSNLVLRIPLLYGVSPGRNAFLERFARREVAAPHPVRSNPLYLPDVLAAITTLQTMTGIVHVGGSQPITRYDFYIAVKEALALNCEIRALPAQLVHPQAARPGASVLASTRTTFRGRPIGDGLADLAVRIRGATETKQGPGDRHDSPAHLRVQNPSTGADDKPCPSVRQPDPDRSRQPPPADSRQCAGSAG